MDRYPLRSGPRVDQVERCVRPRVGEQPGALADDHGADEQGDLVDKLVVEQPEVRAQVMRENRRLSAEALLITLAVLVTFLLLLIVGAEAARR